MQAEEHRLNVKTKDQKYLWHAMSGMARDPSRLVVEKAEGAWITDVDGRRFLDGMAGLWCVNVGYGRKELADAAYEQLREMPYAPLTHAHIPAIRLAEKLNEWLGGDYVIFFANSGSEANETAFKIARQYHQQKGDHTRYKFISRYRAYHGNTMGALGATGQAQRKYKYEPLGHGFVHVQPPDLYRNPADQDTLESAENIDKVIMWELPDTVAAMIMEPIITGGGILMPPDGYMAKVKDICEKHGALLICDEVICGFGRTGERFGFMNYGVKPDIITMAKGITSGYLPLAATAVKREIYEAYAGDDPYDRFRHVNTFGGNPAACALAIKNLGIMEDERLIDRSRMLGNKLLDELKEAEEHSKVGNIRGKGLLIGIELVKDKQTKQPADMADVNKVILACRQKGLIVSKNADTAAGYNNVIQLAPPLSLTEEDLSFIIKALKESLCCLQ
ncbi:aspartate aminotransferase family protein [Bacillus sonorensis]|nr:aspartate aminotransferase family protein [Bacillus sonorensis]MCF7619592.1 aspartate aminotransferase family protein [Bacillus sonorensis]MCY7855955.1 aspartate aminotransferase family protein [Bacillus sonorensis]MCY8405550.1 aspartate aminotransferase family protein [Bacillus sonorensis]MCZ0069850.1 aspartate aminotransferase family protein [Bacillus sonorensis]MCZ0097238.1 aspartate aminotransferase family protein [Bacillus sonorensis]